MFCNIIVLVFVSFEYGQEDIEKTRTQFVIDGLVTTYAIIICKEDAAEISLIAPFASL